MRYVIEGYEKGSGVGTNDLGNSIEERRGASDEIKNKGLN